MRYRDSQLHGVPVFTQSGSEIGRLVGFIVDAETHEVIQYVVKKSGALEILLPKELLVNRAQVVSLSEERLVVADAAVTERSAEEARGTVSKAANPAGLQRTSE
ncbi:MAG: PRC-barrel domain-containing protein [Patescibacteria group bacterium]